ncbi:MAG TPA: M91 family zinc metallopeptidase [Iamia sp.]|nr:M91 family zinc metallopeptidase [Iamia sp.]
MTTSSADPGKLREWSNGAEGVVADLGLHIGPLRRDLDAFRSSSGWQEWLDAVPPYDIDLAAGRSRVEGWAEFVAGVATGFEQADSGSSEGGVVTVDDSVLEPHVPDPPSPVDLVTEGDRSILVGTDGDDHVRVTVEDGKLVVEVFDEHGDSLGRRVLTDAEADGFAIRTGSGDDVIEVDPAVTIGITVMAGDGSDDVGRQDGDPGEYSTRVGGGGDDEIYGGDGDDILAGGAGDDGVYGGEGDDVMDGQSDDDHLSGGEGDDQIYGGNGNDRILGQAGEDYLEGGKGEDTVDGGADDDVVSGGRDQDTIRGGDGDDTLYGGHGRDTVDGGAGSDKAYTQAEDTVNEGLRIEVEVDGGVGGDVWIEPKPDWMSQAAYDEWHERIYADIDLLAASPAGRRVLEEISREANDDWAWLNGADVIRIRPYSFKEYPDSGPHNSRGGEIDGDPGVAFDPNYHKDGGGPTLLVHELSHAYDTQRGEWADDDSLREIGMEDRIEPDDRYRQTEPDGDEHTAPIPEVNSVGIDLDGDGDRDMLDGHPDWFTENEMRDEMGIDNRDVY